MMWKWLSGVFVAALVGLGTLYIPPTVSMAQQSYPLEPFQCPAGQFTYAFNPVTGGLPGWFCAVPGVAKQIVTPPATTVGDLAVWGNTNGTSLIDNGTAFPSITVANNNGLKALPVPTAGTVAYRAGFTTAGDGGGATYTFATANCSISGGDNGSQVQPTAGTGCWLAKFPAGPVDVREWGCVGDGTTDNHACMQAAISAMQNGELFVGAGLFALNSGVTSSGPITVVGARGGQGIYNTTCQTGLRDGAANLVLLALNGAGSSVLHTCIDAGSQSNTSGTAISVIGAENNTLIQDTQINNACIGVDLSGVGTTQNAASQIVGNTIVPANVASCSAIRIGAQSTNGSTVDLKISQNQVYCGTGGGVATGFLFLDAGGPLITNNVAAFGCGYGTKIIPGAHQSAEFFFFNNTPIGDTSTTDDLLIDTTDSTASIFALQFTGSWASASTGGPSILVQNTAGSPNLGGLHFVGHRTYMGGNNTGMDFKAFNDIEVDASTICSAVSSSGTGVVIEGSVTEASIRDSRIGNCDHFGGTLATGISVQTSGAITTNITNNDLISATVPIVFNPGALSGAVIMGNLGVDNIGANVADAATLALPVNPTITITGPASTSISAMTGGWGSRVATLLPNNTYSFVTGGTTGQALCFAYTATQNVPIQAFYEAGNGCWALK